MAGDFVKGVGGGVFCPRIGDRQNAQILGRGSVPHPAAGVTSVSYSTSPNFSLLISAIGLS